MPRLFLPGGFPNQPQGVVPQLKPEFAGATFLYLPSVALLRAGMRPGTVAAGTPVLSHFAGATVSRLQNAHVDFTGTKSLAFLSGMTILAIGAYHSQPGTDIEALVDRGDGGQTGGLTVAITNKWAGAGQHKVYCAYNKPGVGDSAFDSGWINGVKDTATNGNGSYDTVVNKRYVVAVTTATGPPAHATLDLNVGQSGSIGNDESVELVVIWNRAFSEQQLRRISGDPYSIFQAPRRTLLSAPAGGDVTVALTGVSGTGAAGTVAPSTSTALTGNAGTGAAGAVGADFSKALAGNAATGSAGSVTPVRSGAITGVSGAGSPGSVAPSTAKALTGNAATGAVGSLSATSSKALTGTAATGVAGTVGPNATVALTGVSATGEVGSVTAGADATQALTGVSGTGAAGTVSPSVTIALAGVSATGAVGSVTAGQRLTGVAGTGSVGTVAPSTSTALTGIAATGALGSVGANVTVALSGVQASGEVGTISFVSEDITIALSGVEATGEVGVLAVAGEFSEVAAAVWSYVLSNGKTAGQNVVEIRSMLDLLAPGFWNLAIEGTYTAADLLRVIAAVQAGKSTITALGGGAATVEFRAADDSETRVTATMNGSERTEVTLNVD